MPLDNVSVLNRYEREATEWAERTGGPSSNCTPIRSPRTPPQLRRDLVARLHALYPETSSARVVFEQTLCRNDCPPRLAPGDFGSRPSVISPYPGLALAGDGIRIDLPVALMERAATTGLAAANALLDHFGVRGARYVHRAGARTVTRPAPSRRPRREGGHRSERAEPVRDLRA